jgi:hypothetical protein
MMNVMSLVLAAAVALVTGCGGGSGGGSAPSGPAASSTFTLKPSLQGPLASGASIGSIDLTLSLPAGTTVRADSNGQALDGVVTPSGGAAGSLVVARYTPADSSQRAKLRIVLINARGFTTGEFATVQCDLAPGSTPAIGDFTWAALAVTDVDSKAIRGLSAALNQ